MRSLAKATMIAGITYFGLVFAAGFVLGTIRQLWVAPRLGPTLAELIEAPLMLIVIALAANWVVFRFELARHFRARLAVGGIGLALLLVAELTLVLGLRGLTPAEYIATREPVTGTVYLVMLAIFAVMPCLLPREAFPR